MPCSVSCTFISFLSADLCLLDWAINAWSPVNLTVYSSPCQRWWIYSLVGVPASLRKGSRCWVPFPLVDVKGVTSCFRLPFSGINSSVLVRISFELTLFATWLWIISPSVISWLIVNFLIALRNAEVEEEYKLWFCLLLFYLVKESIKQNFRL